MKYPKSFFGAPLLVMAVAALAVVAVISIFPQNAKAADVLAQTQIATAPPAFLRLEVKSNCSGNGAVFKVTNRGGKWPRTGFLKLYYADDKTLIGQRRLRLAGNQRVSFVVKDKIAAGRPVAVWVEPGWYEREFEFDAALRC